jgi:DNA repair ATPase RecN
MKRSFLTSAIILALASTMALTACGGGGGSGEPAKDGDSAKKEDESSGDPAVDLQNLSDGLTKEVDAIVQPLKDVDALIESVTNLPKDLKASKSKADPKKVLAELKKILDGTEPAIDGLKLEADAAKVVQDRIDKLKALQKSITDAPEAAKALPGKVADTLTKAAGILAKALPKYEAKIKAPFGVSAEDKKKAEEDKAKITKIVDDLKAKADGWKNLATELPTKVKEVPTKFAKAFK